MQVVCLPLQDEARKEKLNVYVHIGTDDMTLAPISFPYLLLRYVRERPDFGIAKLEGTKIGQMALPFLGIFDVAHAEE
jgi:hypothetical protein